MTRQEYIKKYQHMAVLSGLRSGLLPSVTLAQGIIESGSGNSLLATPPYNNHFGIKAHGHPNYVIMRTREVINGQDVYIDSKFRVYPSARKSYTDHADFLLKYPNYKKVFESNNYMGQTQALKDGGYATSPTYAYALQNMIKDNNLDKYDWLVANRKLFFCSYQSSFPSSHTWC